MMTRRSRWALHRAGEHHALHVAAEAGHLVGAHGVIDAGHVLLDDRALIEIARGVVGGRADELDAAGVGLVIGARALEGREEAVVDVDHRGAPRSGSPR
jgi:hypothetical protein